MEFSFFNVPDKIFSLSDFSAILQIVEYSKVCTGVINQCFEVLPPGTRNIHNEIIGSVQSVATVDKHGQH